jgi:hypothetical protein
MSAPSGSVLADGEAVPDEPAQVCTNGHPTRVGKIKVSEISCGLEYRNGHGVLVTFRAAKLSE